MKNSIDFSAHLYRVCVLCAVVVICHTVPLCLAHDPPLEEIRIALRTHLPSAPDYGVLLAMDVHNVRNVLENVDEYARLFAPDETPFAFQSIETGRAGIGADLFVREDDFFLVPFQGGALEREGYQERVGLLAVDGLSLDGMGIEQVANLLRGEAGTTVELTLATLATGHSRSVNIRRVILHPMNVELLRTGNNPILRLRKFATGITRTAMLSTMEHIGPQPLLFVDLRESTGGDIHEAFDAAALFVPEGKDLGGLRLTGRPDSSYTSPGGKKISVPLVLLTGPDTASAAEIFAGILHYHGLAFLVGQGTYGKCTTQTDIKLSDGWVLRLTNGEALLPGGAFCPAQGLQPDVLVPAAEMNDLSSYVSRGLNVLQTGRQAETDIHVTPLTGKGHENLLRPLR